MVRDKKFDVSLLLSGVTTMTGLTLEQVNGILSIVLTVLGIISAIISLVLSLSAWYKVAKSDGKITPDEIEDGINIIKDGVDNIIEKIPSKDKMDDNPDQ